MLRGRPSLMERGTSFFILQPVSKHLILAGFPAKTTVRLLLAPENNVLQTVILTLKCYDQSCWFPRASPLPYVCHPCLIQHRSRAPRASAGMVLPSISLTDSRLSVTSLSCSFRLRACCFGQPTPRFCQQQDPRFRAAAHPSSCGSHRPTSSFSRSSTSSTSSTSTESKGQAVNLFSPT